MQTNRTNRTNTTSGTYTSGPAPQARPRGGLLIIPDRWCHERPRMDHVWPIVLGNAGHRRRGARPVGACDCCGADGDPVRLCTVTTRPAWGACWDRQGRRGRVLPPVEMLAALCRDCAAPGGTLDRITRNNTEGGR